MWARFWAHIIGDHQGMACSNQSLIRIAHTLEREECNWMCSFYHPYYACISFVNIYRIKFTKKGVPFC